MKIRVVHLAEAGGGVERHLRDIDKYSSERLENIFVVSPIRNNLRPSRGSLYHVKIKRKISLIPDMLSLIRVIALLKNINPDVIHCHSAKAGGVGRLAAIVLGKPALYSPHAFPFNEYSSRFKGKVFLALEKLLGRMTNTLIASCVSERQLAINKGVTPVRRISVVENGIDVNQYKVGNTHVDNQAIRLLFIGRFTPQKNPMILIPVMEKLVGQGPYTLDLVGEGELVEPLANLISERRMKEKIRVIGRRDISDVVPNSHIVLMPSLWEGLPYALLECLAMGRPVVGANISGIRDVLVDGYNGFLCNPSSVEDISNKVTKLAGLLKFNRDTITANCTQSVSRYDVHNMCAQLESIYRDIVY